MKMIHRQLRSEKEIYKVKRLEKKDWWTTKMNKEPKGRNGKIGKREIKRLKKNMIKLEPNCDTKIH